MSEPSRTGHTAVPLTAGPSGAATTSASDPSTEPAGGWDAVVLCGGAASRFGSDKVLAPLHGRALLSHVLDACAGARRIRLLGTPRELDLPPHASWVPDPLPNAGPLSALVSLVLARGADDRAPWTAVLAGDMPHVAPVLAQLLAAAGGAAVEAGGNADGFGCAMVDRRGQPGVAPMPVLLRTAALERRVAELDFGDQQAVGIPLRRLLDGLDIRTVAEQPADVDVVRDLEVLEQQPE